MEHYHLVKENNNWEGKNGSVTGAYALRGALDIIRPTYLGFHGAIDQWFSDNPELAREFANKVGYWYFPVHIDCPDELQSGKSVHFSITWLNKGYAPAYHAYDLICKLEHDDDPAGNIHIPLEEANNLNWLPGEEIEESYELKIPEGIPVGNYTLKIKLRYTDEITVLLGLQNSLKDKNDFYSLKNLKLSK